MTPKYSTEKIEGIVVKTIPFGDADLILKVICTPGAKLTLFARRARNSKRRFGFGLELFDYGTFEITHNRGSLANVSHFCPKNSFQGFRDCLIRFTTATILAESFEALVHEGESDGREQLDLLLASLKEINSTYQPKEIWRETYLCLSHLLVKAGYKDSNRILAASANRLTAVINEIEHISERPLLSKIAFLSMIDQEKRQGRLSTGTYRDAYNNEQPTGQA